MKVSFTNVKLSIRHWRIGKLIFAGISFALVVLLYIHHLRDGNNWNPPWFATDAHQVFLGILESLLAGVYVAFAAYLFRRELRTVFHSRDVLILAPMQIASAPLIIATTRGIAADHDLRLHLDFRYAGREALATFEAGESKFAVASDVALCFFFNAHARAERRLRVLPFVKITNHLKLVVKFNSSIKSIDDLRNSKGKIGYYDKTVHYHFLLHTLSTDAASRLCDLNNILACYDSLLSDNPSIEAFVLWEPHYAALGSDRKATRLLDDGPSSYDWFLCLVSKEEFLLSEPQLTRRLLNMVTEACEVCEIDRDGNNSNIIVDECSAYMLQEFTGITKDSLRPLAQNAFTFGIARNKEAFMKRMEGLNDSSFPELIAGSTWLSDVKHFWPGVDDL